MWHKRITLALAVLAVLLLAVSGPGTRADLWPFRVGFGMFAGALFVGLTAAGAALVGPVAATVAGGIAAIAVTLLWAGLFPALRQARTFDLPEPAPERPPVVAGGA